MSSVNSKCSEQRVSIEVDSEGLSIEVLRQAFLIRETEQRFLELFSEGRLSGTVHTCVGQEFSALAFAGQLQAGDTVFSNHRCHGHYLAFTRDLDGLIAEMLGKSSGVCGGVGGSQHLCKDGFFSNGIQGGGTPIAAGMAWANKFRGMGGVGVVYIGDGTLGEGLVYEAMNLAQTFGAPVLFVCEDNGVAQSTDTSRTMSGEIVAKPAAFGLRTWSGTSDDPEELYHEAKSALDWVRTEQMPGFFCVRTARLNAHSKSDDDRPKDALLELSRRDYLNRAATAEPRLAAELRREARTNVDLAIEKAESAPAMRLDDYLALPAQAGIQKTEKPNEEASGQRVVARINHFLREMMSHDPTVFMVGEDVADPYGGAFKVTKGLSSSFPDRVFSTPISEAGLVGFSSGLALAGMRPWAELMFGDFATLAFDQIINHAGKFRHMYNRQVNCPLVVRMAVGGGRGYGPTHSQSLEKFLCGIDNVKVIALNAWIDPAILLAPLKSTEDPAIVVEHKLDYGRRIALPALPGYRVEIPDGDHPWIALRPVESRPIATIVTYGGMAGALSETLPEMVESMGAIVEVVILCRLSPLDFAPVVESVSRSACLIVVEEGGTPFGIGAEVIASVVESGVPLKWARRIGGAAVPIPAVPDLEAQCIPIGAALRESLAKAIELCPRK